MNGKLFRWFRLLTANKETSKKKPHKSAVQMQQTICLHFSKKHHKYLSGKHFNKIINLRLNRKTLFIRNYIGKARHLLPRQFELPQKY